MGRMYPCKVSRQCELTLVREENLFWPSSGSVEGNVGIIIGYARACYDGLANSTLPVFDTHVANALFRYCKSIVSQFFTYEQTHFIALAQLNYPYTPVICLNQ